MTSHKGKAIDERLSKITTAVFGESRIRRRGDKYECECCGLVKSFTHHPKKCPKCESTLITRVERAADDKKIVHHPPTGRCATCSLCTIAPRSKWSAKIGLCHAEGTPKIVSLNDGCRRRGIGKATKLRFGRRSGSDTDLTLADNIDHVWDGILKKDATLRRLLNKKARKKHDVKRR